MEYAEFFAHFRLWRYVSLNNGFQTEMTCGKRTEGECKNAKNERMNNGFAINFLHLQSI